LRPNRPEIQAVTLKFAARKAPDNTVSARSAIFPRRLGRRSRAAAVLIELWDDNPSERREWRLMTEAAAAISAHGRDRLRGWGTRIRT
jgi:hypothetical protein